MSQKRTWCDYDVQKNSKEGTEFFIRSNGSWQGNGVAHMYAERGIEFNQGKGEKTLWHVRGPAITPLAKQEESGTITVITSNLIAKTKDGNVQILGTTPWIEVGDGFVITSPGQSFTFKYMENSQRHDDYAPVIEMTY